MHVCNAGFDECGEPNRISRRNRIWCRRRTSTRRIPRQITVDKLQDELKVADLIKRLENPQVSPAEFLHNLLAALCLLSKADGGAILRNSQKRQVDILALYPQCANDVSAPEWLIESAELANKAFSSDNPVVKSFGEHGHRGHPSTKRSVLMIPLHVAEIGQAVAAFVMVRTTKRPFKRASRDSKY